MFAHLLHRLLLLAAATSLVACHLYVDGGDEGSGDYGENCRGENCSPATPNYWPDGGVPVADGGIWDNPEPPQSCTIDFECGPGCYCNPGGLCEEVPPTPLPAPDAAPFGCSDLSADESACIANQSCTPVYRGIDCTAEDGSECTSASAECTCESFQYDYCEEALP